MNKYIIINDKNLFYVDRKLNKRDWWTANINHALIFISFDYARRVVANFKYGNHKVITYAEALHIDPIEDEHPFSMDGTDWAGAR